jgi:uncharacterized RDD family membrane protein YckC
MNENPYTTPVSDSVVEEKFDGGIVLADRGERFGAAFIDGLINGGLGFGIGKILGIFYVQSAVAATTAKVTWLDPPAGGYGWAAAELVIHFLAFLAVNWVFLNETGQTIGKKLLKIRIATMDGQKPGMAALILKRYTLLKGIELIPTVGPFIALGGILMIFRSDRRCLHDFIAGTQVVKCTDPR